MQSCRRLLEPFFEAGIWKVTLRGTGNASSRKIKGISNKSRYITVYAVQTYMKKVFLYTWLLKHSRSLNFADMSTSFSNCHAEFTVPLLHILKYAWLFLIIEFSSRIYDVFFSARFLTASFAPKNRRKNSVRWNMLLSFINAEMSHDSLVG